MTGMRTAISIVFLFVVTNGVFSLRENVSRFGPEDLSGDPLGLQPLIMAALMLFGVIFGATYAELQYEGLSVALAFKRAWVRPAMYRALLVAPIVFGGVYAFARSTSDPIVIAIFAFQNGFFCETVFRKANDSAPKSTAR